MSVNVAGCCLNVIGCHYVSLHVITCRWMTLDVTGHHWMSLHSVGCCWTSLEVARCYTMQDAARHHARHSKTPCKTQQDTMKDAARHVAVSHWMPFDVIGCHWMLLDVVGCYWTATTKGLPQSLSFESSSNLSTWHNN